MRHNTDELVKEAKEIGFSQAGELNLSALVFMPEVRDMCTADRCRQFGKNWRCPPDHINKQVMINLEVIFVYVVRSFTTVIGCYINVQSSPPGNSICLP